MAVKLETAKHLYRVRKMENGSSAVVPDIVFEAVSFSLYRIPSTTSLDEVNVAKDLKPVEGTVQPQTPSEGWYIRLLLIDGKDSGSYGVKSDEPLHTVGQTRKKQD